MSTKNIGQVSGVHIGSTPPVNIIMIWYDNTPSQMVHKVYDVNLSQWVVLDKNTISTITYSELVNLATSVGLSVGAWFKISDRSNALALAVTTTKVQYSDSLGNVLIDDLGTNIQYHVTSSNLSIDDVVGVFDNVNKKLVFQFNEQVPDYTADDFILGKVKRNNIWSLAKYKLSSFLSKVTGNSISWNGGFFFNFNNAVSNILDKTGGVVSKDTYDEDLENVNTAINNIGQENQTIIQNANQAITNATLPTAIYEKALPSDLEVGGAATNISKGDTLYTLISKIQRWINQFKLATGVKISPNFTQATSEQFINSNDSVESALGKVQYRLNHAGASSKLSSDWAPKDHTGVIADVADGDSLDEAFAKAIGKLNQIGDIGNGNIQSKATVNGSNARRTQLNLGDGSLTFNRDVTSPGTQQTVTLSKDSGLYMNNSSGKNARLSAEGLRLEALTNQDFQLPFYEDRWNYGTIYGAAAALFTAQGTNLGTSVGIAAAISALCTQGSLSSEIDVFDAYFAKLKGGSVSYGRINMETDLYMANDCSFVTCTNTENRNLFLPSSPLDGQMIIVNQVNAANVAVWGNGHKIIDDEDADYINIGGARRVAIFLYHSSLIPSAGLGAWLFFRWTR